MKSLKEALIKRGQQTIYKEMPKLHTGDIILKQDPILRQQYVMFISEEDMKELGHKYKDYGDSLVTAEIIAGGPVYRVYPMTNYSYKTGLKPNTDLLKIWVMPEDDPWINIKYLSKQLPSCVYDSALKLMIENSKVQPIKL